MRWRIRANMFEGLDPLLDELGEPHDNPRYSVYKDDPAGSMVFTVKINRPGIPGELFVKVYREKSIFRRLWSLVNETPAHREWRMAEEHYKRGLPVAAYLAFGRRHRGWLKTEELLVQESLTNYRPFHEYFRTTFRPELPGADLEHKRRVISDLAGLFRRMHDQGIIREDLEPKNLMATRKGRGRLSMIFVDLDKTRSKPTRRTPAPAQSRRIEAMASFNMAFAPLLSQGYRIRFLRDYFKPDGLNSNDFADVVRKIMDHSEQLSRTKAAKLLKGAYRGRSPHFSFTAGDWRAWIRKPLYQNSLLDILDDLPQTVKDRKLVKVHMTGETEPRKVQVIACQPASDLARRWISAAKWGYLMAAALEFRRTKHRRVLAAVEARHRAWAKESYLLVEVPPQFTYNLAEYLARKVADEFSGIPWERSILSRLARVLLNLHEMKLIYREPRGDDIYVMRTETGAHEFLLSNLHSLRSNVSLNMDTAVAHIAGLFSVLPISEADGIMVVEEYLRYSRRFREQRSEFLKRFRLKAREWMLTPEVKP